MQSIQDCQEPERLAAKAAAKQPREASAQTAQNHRLDGDLWVEVVRSWGDFLGREALWDDLSANAAEPNIFHERWFLEPAVRSFSDSSEVLVAFVYRRSRRQDIPPALVGVFPFQRTPGRGGMLQRLSLFEHPYSFLLDPLIREGHEIETWQAILNWAGQEAGADLVELPLMRGEGSIAQSLVEVLRERQALSLVAESHARAMLRRAESGEQYLQRSLTSKQRHEYARQFRRLGDDGPLEFRELEDVRDLARWKSDFLELEANGWKGAAQTAIAQTEASRQFFETVIQTAAAQGCLQMLGLFRGDRALAMKLNFLAAPGSFAFKIAYDESLSKFSPGVQLELESIRRLHEAPSLAWMDSCAAPDHPMINRLWRERIIIQRVLVSTGTFRGNLAVGLRPLARAGRRLFRRDKSTAGPVTSKHSSQETS